MMAFAGEEEDGLVSSWQSMERPVVPPSHRQGPRSNTGQSHLQMASQRGTCAPLDTSVAPRSRLISESAGTWRYGDRRRGLRSALFGRST